MTRLFAGGLGNLGFNPGRRKGILLWSTLNGSKVQLASYSVGIYGSILESKADREWSYPLCILLTENKSSFRHCKQWYLQACKNMAGYFPLDFSIILRLLFYQKYCLLLQWQIRICSIHIGALSHFVHTSQFHKIQMTSEMNIGKKGRLSVLFNGNVSW